jgi:hypothetical protein
MTLRITGYSVFVHRPVLKNTRKDNVSETGSVSETFLSSFLEYRTMDNVRKPSSSKCFDVISPNYV